MGILRASAYAAKNDIFSNYNAEKSARVCVVRGFNKNNVTPPEVKKDEKKGHTGNRIHSTPLLGNPLCPTLSCRKAYQPACIPREGR